jgi:hypothetical protein
VACLEASSDDARRKNLKNNREMLLKEEHVHKILLVLIAALAVLVPTAAQAAPKPQPTITYTTTASFPGEDFQTTATISNVRFELNPVLAGNVCVGYDVQVHGEFQYWTGAYFTTMRQLAPQHQQECYSLIRDTLQTALDCPAGTFELGVFVRSPRIAFTGDDGSTLFTHAQLGPYTLTATTPEQQDAICGLEGRLDRYGDKKLVAELNELLGLFA